MFPFFQSGADIQLLHSRSPLSDLFKKKETAGHQKIVKNESFSTMEPKYLRVLKICTFLAIDTGIFDGYFIFLNLKICILATKNCAKFQSLKACKDKKVAFDSIKIQQHLNF